MDTLSKTERSKRMSLVRSKGTKLELKVGKIIRALGYRFISHDSSLPGSPDFVFRTRRKVIFVHGCFWHRHSCSNGTRLPKSRKAFWSGKLEKNWKRDRQVQRLINKRGWKCLVIWECGTKSEPKLTKKIGFFLENK